MIPQLTSRAGFAAGVVLVALGIAAPAYAEGDFNSYMNDWSDGDKSRTWQDLNSDGDDTHVTFRDCTREFRAYIVRERFGPDTTVADEWINCRSYNDAVRAGDVAADHYHFDIGGMGAVCHSGQCTPRETTVKSLTVYW